MANLILDTHAAVHELMNAGMPQGQAETVVRQHVKLIEHNLATKTDLKDIITSIEATNTRIENLHKETTAEIKGVKAEIEILRQETIARIEAAKVDLIKWIFAMNLGTAGLIVALIKLL